MFGSSRFGASRFGASESETLIEHHAGEGTGETVSSSEGEGGSASAGVGAGETVVTSFGTGTATSGGP